MKRITSVEDHKLNAAYEASAKHCGRPKLSDRLDKPLAFWALPNDRRLPMALLGFSLREILRSVDGRVGRRAGHRAKKLNSLIKLLQRATKDDPPGASAF